DSPSLFGTLIHSCYSKTQRPALGQIWIGAVGQYWIGANRLYAVLSGNGWLMQISSDQQL
ncbi:hypothetical protein, partial [Janthinobacterium sp.]|uniref:hypothetical protein n=1 Tax=Janthinobacterium sp. TaxID=1871054 RepID=UPI00293D8CE8